MPLNANELIEAAEIVARDKEMKVTLKWTGAASMFTAATTFGGGMTLGPIGLAVGATLGGILSALYSKDKFKSVVDIIREDLTPQQRQALVGHLERAVRDVDITDAITLATLVMSHEALTLAIFSGLKNFLTNELRLELKN